MEQIVWNQQCPIPPAFVTVPCSRTALPPVAEAREASNCMCQAIASLNDSSSLDKEMFLVSRMIYRFTNNLGRHRAIQGLKKIKKCMDRWNVLDLAELLKPLYEDLRMISSVTTSSTVYIQSASRLQYFLTRLMGSCALLAQTNLYCMHTFICSYQEINYGNFIPNMLVFMACASRIRILCLNLLLKLVQCYKHTHQILEHLYGEQSGGDLPGDLDAWLITQGYHISLTPHLEKRKVQSLESLDVFLLRYSSTSISDYTNMMDTLDFSEIWSSDVPRDKPTTSPHSDDNNNPPGTSTVRADMSQSTTLQVPEELSSVRHDLTTVTVPMSFSNLSPGRSKGSVISGDHTMTLSSAARISSGFEDMGEVVQRREGSSYSESCRASGNKMTRETIESARRMIDTDLAAMEQDLGEAVQRSTVYKIDTQSSEVSSCQDEAAGSHSVIHVDLTEPETYTQHLKTIEYEVEQLDKYSSLLPMERKTSDLPPSSAQPLDQKNLKEKCDIMIGVKRRESDTGNEESSDDDDDDVPTSAKQIKLDAARESFSIMFDSPQNMCKSVTVENEVSPVSVCTSPGLLKTVTSSINNTKSSGEETLILLSDSVSESYPVKHESLPDVRHELDVTAETHSASVGIPQGPAEILETMKSLPIAESSEPKYSDHNSLVTEKKNDPVLVRELQRAVRRVKWVISSQPLFKTVDKQLSLLSLVEFFLHLLPEAKIGQHKHLKTEFTSASRKKFNGNSISYNKHKFITKQMDKFFRSMQSILEQKLHDLGEHVELEEDFIVEGDELGLGQSIKAFSCFVSQAEHKKAPEVEQAVDTTDIISDKTWQSAANQTHHESSQMARTIFTTLDKVWNCPNEGIHTVLVYLNDIMPTSHLKQFNHLKRRAANPNLKNFHKLRNSVKMFLQQLLQAIEETVPLQYRSAVSDIKKDCYLMKKEKHYRDLIKQAVQSKQTFTDIKGGSWGNSQKVKSRSQLQELSVDMIEYDAVLFKGLLSLVDKLQPSSPENHVEDVCMKVLYGLQAFVTWCKMKITQIMCQRCQDVQTEILKQPKFTSVITGLCLVESLAMEYLPDAFSRLLVILCPTDVNMMVLNDQQLNAVMIFMDHLKKSASSCAESCEMSGVISPKEHPILEFTSQQSDKPRPPDTDHSLPAAETSGKSIESTPSIVIAAPSEYSVYAHTSEAAVRMTAFYEGEMKLSDVGLKNNSMEMAKNAQKIHDVMKKVEISTSASEVLGMLSSVKSVIPQNVRKTYEEAISNFQASVNDENSLWTASKHEMLACLQDAMIKWEAHLPEKFRTVLGKLSDKEEISLFKSIKKRAEGFLHSVSQMAPERELDKQKVQLQSHLDVFQKEFMKCNAEKYSNISRCIRNLKDGQWNIFQEVKEKIIAFCMELINWCASRITSIELQQNLTSELSLCKIFEKKINKNSMQEQLKEQMRSLRTSATMLMPGKYEELCQDLKQKSVRKFVVELQKCIKSELITINATRGREDYSGLIRKPEEMSERKSTGATAPNITDNVECTTLVSIIASLENAAESFSKCSALDALMLYRGLEMDIPKHLRGRYVKFRKRIERVVKGNSPISEALSNDVSTFLKDVKKHLISKLPVTYVDYDDMDDAEIPEEKIVSDAIKYWKIAVKKINNISKVRQLQNLMKQGKKHISFNTEEFMEISNEVKEKAAVSKELAVPNIRDSVKDLIIQELSSCRQQLEQIKHNSSLQKSKQANVEKSRKHRSDVEQEAAAGEKKKPRVVDAEQIGPSFSAETECSSERFVPPVLLIDSDDLQKHFQTTLRNKKKLINLPMKLDKNSWSFTYQGRQVLVSGSARNDITKLCSDYSDKMPKTTDKAVLKDAVVQISNLFKSLVSQSCQ